MRFTPIVTKETLTCHKLGKQLLPHLTTDYQEFLSFLKTSNMSLSDTLIAAKTLVYTNQAMMAVNRIGHFYAIRKKHSWEK